MIAWRTDAVKGRTQEQLSKKFDLKVERFDKTKPKTNKRKAHALKSEEKKQESEKKQDSDNDKSDNVKKRSRIHLAKSGHILTERNA